MVGNKYDLFESEQVDEDIVKKYAADNQMKFKYVSALTGRNTNELFQEIVDEYLSKGTNNRSDSQHNQKLHNKKQERRFKC